MQFDTIILGAGPAGLAAGIYLARAKQRVMIIDEKTEGGQIIMTHAIANYPGVEEISGYKLAGIMKKQARDFGCRFSSGSRIKEYDIGGVEKKVTDEEGSIFASKSLIIAAGGSPRTLGLPSESRFKGEGISYCATCDGDFFQGQDIAVIGGGNSALQEAVSLTKFAKSVTIIHQFENFQGFKHAIEEAKSNPAIKMIMESDVVEFIGDERLKQVKFHDKRNNTDGVINVTGAFIFIGYEPATRPFEGIVEMNQRKEIVVNEDMATSVKGVFAAGDVIDKKIRQITTSVADGTIAALSAVEYNSKA
jgi:thioredoxin reductase (NADPH)